MRQKLRSQRKMKTAISGQKIAAQLPEGGDLPPRAGPVIGESQVAVMINAEVNRHKRNYRAGRIGTPQLVMSTLPLIPYVAALNVWIVCQRLFRTVYRKCLHPVFTVARILVLRVFALVSDFHCQCCTCFKLDALVSTRIRFW